VTRGDARVDGILVVDKPVGPTSHDVVALIRRLAGTRKIGHGGTLDPFASGVLPLYLGLGTRVVEFHFGARKAYRATVVFGGGSTTDDLEGEITPAEGAPPTRDAVESALAGFVGSQEQRPPAYSARKVGGRRAYALARRGETPELKPRTVTFHELALVAWDGATRSTRRPSSTSPAPRARTSGRWPATSGTRSGAPRTWGRSGAPLRAPSRSPTPTRSTRSAPRRPGNGLPTCSCPPAQASTTCRR